MRLGTDTTVGVVGAGAMGSGIAQVALLAGHPVVLGDARSDALPTARSNIAAAMTRDVEKGRLAAEARDAALGRLTLLDPSQHPGGFAPCGLVIEAIVERLDAKQQLFRALEDVILPDAVLATNTSSLSIAAIGSSCARPGRVIGLHFFNPAPVLPLVEVIPGVQTAPAVTTAAFALMQAWQKMPVRASDTPGFIVNRIARPFYSESLRLLDEGVADAATIDWAMRSVGKYRMGPFELMDFIGHDVNYVVTETVWRAMYCDPRYRPSLTQLRLLEAGWLGRKAGRGFFDYAKDATPPVVTEDAELARTIFTRVMVMVANEAIDAVFLRVASPADIEVSMTRGVNYPQGPLAWAESFGLPQVLAHLEALQAEYGEDRYRPSPLLRRLVKAGGSLLA